MPKAKKTPFDRFVEELLARAERSRSAPRGHPSPGLQARDPEAQPDGTLLNTPLAALKEPLPVWSALLQDTIYLVPDEATAHRLLAEGKVAYYPQEVAILLEIKARWPETWREKVQTIHLAKKELGGLVRELSGDA